MTTSQPSARERLASLEAFRESQVTQCKTCQDRLLDDVGKMQKTITSIKESVCGNGKIGLVVRVDRLEVEAAESRWLRRTRIAAYVSVLVAVLVYAVPAIAKLLFRL